MEHLARFYHLIISIIIHLYILKKNIAVKTVRSFSWKNPFFLCPEIRWPAACVEAIPSWTHVDTGRMGSTRNSGDTKRIIMT